MTRARSALLLALALSFAACHPVAWAEGDYCPPETTTTTTTTTSTTTTSTVPATTPTVPQEPSTTIPAISTPADPIPEPTAPQGDVCIDTNGDGVGSTAQSVHECYTTPEAELWATTVYAISARYGVATWIANAWLIALLTQS